MRFYLLAFAMFLLCSKTNAQGPNLTEEPVFDMDDVDRIPQFPGGDLEFIKFFNRNLQLPAASDSLFMVGKIMTEFVVETDGRITSLEFRKKTVLDNAVRQLFQKMPNWEPGKHRGTFVRVRCRLPIFIKID